MKLCLVKVVFMLIITSYKGMMDAESLRLMCTNEYPVSHLRERPDYIYFLDEMPDRLVPWAAQEECQDYCNQDVTCRSVGLVENTGYPGYWGYWTCTKYSITLQELKDTGRNNEIETETELSLQRINNTYDRKCVNVTSNTTLTTSPTTSTMLSGAMCTYPVSHDREAPVWELYHIDDDFLRDDNATKETCRDYCNKNEKCRSVLHIIHGDGRRYCYRFNITVQELKDTQGYLDIYTQTDTNWAPAYITYDRDCGECRNPMSHDWEDPTLEYRITWMRDDSATRKSCQDWCNKDGNCKSVTYRVWQDSRYCIKYNISVQELKDSGRDNEIYKWYSLTHITYDRDCADHPSTYCSNTYPVSHDRQNPDWGIYNISRRNDSYGSPKTCQDWCNQDVHCRSVMYEIVTVRNHYCYKFSISVQKLKDMGRYYEIETKDTGSITTYDKQCVHSLRFMCSNKYPVSHDWERPAARIYRISWKPDDGATPETCQDWCNQDVHCRSVTYEINGDGWHLCSKFSISVQELKDMGRDDEIFNLTDTDRVPVVITYDRDCVEVSPTTKGPITAVDEVSPATKGPGTNGAAIGEPMIVLIVMIGAGAVFLAPMLPGAEIAF